MQQKIREQWQQDFCSPSSAPKDLRDCLGFFLTVISKKTLNPQHMKPKPSPVIGNCTSYLETYAAIHWNSWRGWWNKITHFWALTSLAEMTSLFKHDQHFCRVDKAVVLESEGLSCFPSSGVGLLLDSWQVLLLHLERKRKRKIIAWVWRAWKSYKVRGPEYNCYTAVSMEPLWYVCMGPIPWAWAWT